VEPFFFGSRQLYGCLHPAEGSLAAVVCQPFGHEYELLHRAMRLLASRLSARGVATLRFDYSGTGDSAGDLSESRLADWRADIDEAVETVVARTGASAVCLVGARLGASLAARAACERDDVPMLALWDPLVEGATYLRELEQDMRRMLRVAHVRRFGRRPSDGSIEVLGHRVSAGLRSEIEALDLRVPLALPATKVLLLESSGQPSASLSALFEAAGCVVEARGFDFPRLWRWQEDPTRVLLPHPLVKSLGDWVAGQSR